MIEKTLTIPGSILQAQNMTYDNSNSGLEATDVQAAIDEIKENSEVNVQSDWEETDHESDAFIQNKPTFEVLTVEDVERMTGLSTEELEGLASVISDTEVRIDKTYSSSKINELITQAQLSGSEVDLSGYAKTEDIPDVSNFVEKEDGKGLFSGSYNDLTDQPEIPSIDDLVSEESLNTTLADYAKTENLPDVSNFVEKEEGKGLFSGSYNDLTDQPEIPSIEGLVSEESLNTTLADYAKTENIPDEYDDTELVNRVTANEESIGTNTSAIGELDGRVDALETNLDGHTVKSDVPADAKFTDTTNFLPLAGGTMDENARVVIQNNNYMAGFIAKCGNVSEAWLDGESIGIRNYAAPHEYCVMDPTGVEISDDDGTMSITKTDITFGDRSKKLSSTGYGINIIDSVNEHNAFFGINLWSNGGDTDHNMYCFQGDSFYAELYTGQPDLGNANAKWDNVYAETSQITTSDRREKTDIVDLDDETTKELIMALKPSSYKFVNNTSDRTHYGLIAQDVEETMNRLGMTGNDFAGFIKSPKMIASEDNPKEKVVVEGEYVYGLRYEEFIAPLIKMIQLQQKQIDELVTKVETLSN